MATQNFGLFLPTSETISTQLVIEATKGNIPLQQALIKIIQAFNNSNIAINQKETGNYITDEFNTGKIYFGNPTRPVFRKVVDFGTLPNTATKSVAHGLTPTANWLFVGIEAYAADPIGLNWIQISYASPVLANNIEIYVDAVNVNIITGSNRTAFTKCYVVLEYIKT